MKIMSINKVKNNNNSIYKSEFNYYDTFNEHINDNIKNNDKNKRKLFENSKDNNKQSKLNSENLKKNIKLNTNINQDSYLIKKEKKMNSDEFNIFLVYLMTMEKMVI